MNPKLLSLLIIILIQSSLVKAGENIAYKKTCTATSIESSNYKAEYAVDADGNTRWSSQNYDQQNLIVDLWKLYTVSAVKIHWEAAYASQYQIQISADYTDDSIWMTVYENYQATGGTVTINFSPVKAQFVKIYCIKRATENGFSIAEFEIYENNFENHIPLTNLIGKNLVFLGSSVTYGSAAGGVSFVEYIEQRNDCTCKKEAVSGTTLVDSDSSSYVQRMKNNLDKNTKFDHFICQLSTNDASQNKPLGKMSDSYNLEDFDTSTIYGAMEYIICYARQTWNCPISFYTNTYYESSNYLAMISALYKLKDKWNIGIIDLYNNQAMRDISESDYQRYMADNIHPTAIGYLEWWTPVFEDYFQSFDYGYDVVKAKQNVLNYLYSIKGQKTIIGIHNREPNSEPSKQTDAVKEVTGKYPALWSGDFLFTSDDVKYRYKMINECIKQWRKGSIVQLMLHVVSVTQSEPGVWDGGVISTLSDDEWTSLITNGGSLNRKWKSRLDIYASYIQDLKDVGVPVLFRPLHENNLVGVFWWAGRKGENGSGALFRLTREYLEKDKGLDNIIWVWDTDDCSLDWSDFNPGNDYWDIFAVDFYSADYYTYNKYNLALSIGGDKLIAVGECDKLPTSSELYNQPNWSFVMSWAELTFEKNTNTEIQNLYWAENVIIQEELPEFE